MFRTFGNKVRIKSSEVTRAKGLAGKTGEICGETTRSSSQVEVIGTPKTDYAINVHVDDLRESFWFDEDILEQLDDGLGTVMTLHGIDKKWIKGENGEWIEINISS
jgi:hypothetical protein